MDLENMSEEQFNTKAAVFKRTMIEQGAPADKVSEFLEKKRKEFRTIKGAKSGVLDKQKAFEEGAPLDVVEETPSKEELDKREEGKVVKGLVEQMLDEYETIPEEDKGAFEGRAKTFEVPFTDVGPGQFVAPEAVEYNETVQGLAGTIKEAAGEEGRLTDLDIVRIVNLLPKVTDTDRQVERSVERLEGLLKNKYDLELKEETKKKLLKKNKDELEDTVEEANVKDGGKTTTQEPQESRKQLPDIPQENQTTNLEQVGALPEFGDVGGSLEKASIIRRDFIKNFIPSLGRTAGSIAQAAANPIETVDGLARITAGALDIGLEQVPGWKEFKKKYELPEERSTSEKNKKLAKAAFKQLIVDRYGSKEKAEETFRKDPAGVVLDISTFLGIAGAGVKTGGKVSKVAGATKRASKLDDAARVLQKSSRATDPVELGIRGASKGFAASKRGVGKVGKGILNQVGESAAARMHRASPAVFEDAVEAGIDMNKTLKSILPEEKLKTVEIEDLVGDINQKGKGGIIKKEIDKAEDTIQSTIKKSGDNTVISTEEFVEPLLNKRAELSKIPGNERKVAALDDVITEAKSLYPEGLNAEELLTIKRVADDQFGKAVVEETTGSVINSSQKVMANKAREVLKNKFNSIKEALDRESELYTIRPVVNRARAIEKTQGSGIRRGSLASVDITKPMTIVDVITQNPKVVSLLAKLQRADNIGPSLSRVPGASRLPDIPETGIGTFTKSGRLEQQLPDIPQE